ncbi:FUSC family protein [Falsibacillus pallidus]|uniref:Uncharacterized membrane protein YgaE (UPF0421/DUF939 family) n=1 Tax=Falsibacillus pallidus TaxID=493781 RepID=A0A370H0Y7_9BACI|nr:aromatic acid exporter family protein [Falsibacillus pallidus]RDI47713.1 uncharacterized membrane protein YgaE (UPF0421/DUF939 family) [Falsibacillus pallidus]
MRYFEQLKKWRIIGGRTLKTGIAVFLTSFLCHLLHWPSVFAVVTAIVTIEPTASDSIRKGMVRFPASAIGAAFAMILTSFFGDEPLTYAFAAILTISFCHRFKLYDGMVVATLTAVAMIPSTHDHFLINFFVRLGTTTIGLAVSTLVNLFIWPPDYSTTIREKVKNLHNHAAQLLEARISELLQFQKSNRKTKQQFRDFVTLMNHADKLCEFQREEWKFHRNSKQRLRQLHYFQKKLQLIRQFAYHLGNMMYVSPSPLSWNEEEKKKILEASRLLAFLIRDPSIDHRKELALLKEELPPSPMWTPGVSENNKAFMSEESIILYELLSLFDIIDEQRQIYQFEIRRMKIAKKMFLK